MSSSISSALSLLRDSSNRFDLAASNLANINTPDYQAVREDGKLESNDIATGMVETIVSSGAYRMGVKMLEIEDQTIRSLIDIRA